MFTLREIVALICPGRGLLKTLLRFGCDSSRGEKGGTELHTRMDAHEGEGGWPGQCFIDGHLATQPWSHTGSATHA